MKPYNPHESTARVLNWLLPKVKEVPYKVPLRWAFYRCVQEMGLAKDKYDNFGDWVTEARRRMYNGWMPDTLVDDTRPIYMRGFGYDSFEDWFKTMKDENPMYHKFANQDYLPMVGYEARAMHRQFDHYLKPLHIPLAPFGGDPGPPFKWAVAKKLNAMLRKFPEKSVVLLYFGDYEPIQKTGSRGKGIRIPLDALKEIRPYFHAHQRAWRPEEDVVDIEFVRCGLNPEHIEKYDIPENPDRPREYQWEALDDKDAKEVIMESIDKYWDSDALQEVEGEETEDQDDWKTILFLGREIFDSVMPREVA